MYPPCATIASRISPSWRATAVRIASKTVKQISGIEVEHMTATVKGGKIANYKTTVKVAFGVDS